MAVLRQLANAHATYVPVVATPLRSPLLLETPYRASAYSTSFFYYPFSIPKHLPWSPRPPSSACVHTMAFLPPPPLGVVTASLMGSKQAHLL